MSEKSGYGAQIFILIIAIVLLASLSRVKHTPVSSEPDYQRQLHSHVQETPAPDN